MSSLTSRTLHKLTQFPPHHQVCVDAQVSVGPVYASARASATADVNLEKLSASATATAHVKAKVGDLVDADSKVIPTLYEQCQRQLTLFECRLMPMPRSISLKGKQM